MHLKLHMVSFTLMFMVGLNYDLSYRILCFQFIISVASLTGQTYKREHRVIETQNVDQSSPARHCEWNFLSTSEETMHCVSRWAFLDLAQGGTHDQLNGVESHWLGAVNHTK